VRRHRIICRCEEGDEWEGEEGAGGLKVMEAGCPGADAAGRGGLGGKCLTNERVDKLCDVVA